MSLKNPVTPPGMDRVTVRLVAQRLNHYPTPHPHKHILRRNNYKHTTLNYIHTYNTLHSRLQHSITFTHTINYTHAYNTQLLSHLQYITLTLTTLNYFHTYNTLHSRLQHSITFTHSIHYTHAYNTKYQ